MYLLGSGWEWLGRRFGFWEFMNRQIILACDIKVFNSFSMKIFKVTSLTLLVYLTVGLGLISCPVG